jgi:hypothetical protein
VSEGDGCNVAEEIALGTRVLAFRCEYHVHSGTEVTLFLAELGRRVPVLIASGWDDAFDAYNLTGAGRLIVFNTGRDRVLWRIASSSTAARPCPVRRTRRCVRIARGVNAADVSAGRIAGWRTNGQFVLLDGAGRLLKEPRIRSAGAKKTALRGDELYVARRGVLRRYDLNTAHTTGRWVLFRPNAEASFQAVGAGYAAYTVNPYSVNERLILMRLRDGQRIAIRRSDPTEDDYRAAFGTDGLHYVRGFSEANSERPDELVFIPYEELALLFGA